MKLSNTIIPLLGSTEGGKPCPVGSGILLVAGCERFLVTAAHVLDENKITTLYLPGESELVVVSGHARQSRAPNGDRGLDRFDTAYIHLSEEIVSRISRVFWFLPTQMVDVNDISVPGKHYQFSGYPHKAIKEVYGARKINAQLHTYTDLASEDAVYADVDANPASNIVIHFDAKKARDAAGKKVIPKERQGMSGGGVWNYCEQSRVQGLPKIRLCGVAIEHHRKHKCLVATRINYLIESIRFDFPDLSQFLPISDTLDVLMKDQTSWPCPPPPNTKQSKPGSSNTPRPSVGRLCRRRKRSDGAVLMRLR